MFPASLYPVSLFPAELFPKVGGSAGTSRYGDILVSAVERILTASGIFTANTTFLTLWPEPFPTAGGPLAYVMPGAWRQEATHIDGAGRYFSVFDSQFTVRVIDRSVRDPAFVDSARLTLLPSGIERTVHQIINILDIDFLYAEDEITPLVVEPLKLLTVAKPRVYSRGKGAGANQEWAYIDLVFNARNMLNFINYPLPDLSAADSVPAATNLADLLLAVQSLIVETGTFTANQCFITLSGEPFPQVGTPFCTITPGDFKTVDGHFSGDGRYMATLDGTFTISIITRNVMDQGYLDYQRLLNPNTIYGLYSVHQAMLEGTHLQFPVDPDGLSLTEEAIRLVSVATPRYYGDAKSWCALDSTYSMRYFPDVTLPDA